MTIQNQQAQRLKDICDTYSFSTDSAATQRLRESVPFPVHLIFKLDNTLAFTRWDNCECIALTDQNFNLLETYSLTECAPWKIISITPYKQHYIVIDVTGTKKYLFSTDFSQHQPLHAELPYTENLNLSGALCTPEGILYLTEKYTGRLFRIDQNGAVNEYPSNFQQVHFMASINETLYMADQRYSTTLQKGTMLTFSDEKFDRIAVSGQCIAVSHKTQRYFVSELAVDHSVKAYDFSNRLVFTKHFRPDNGQCIPYSPQVVGEYLVINDMATFKPCVFRI